MLIYCNIFAAVQCNMATLGYHYVACSNILASASGYLMDKAEFKII